MKIPVLNAGEGRTARLIGLRAGVDFVDYEQVPLGPRDIVFDYSKRRWVDRRSTDGEVLAADGRNGRPTELRKIEVFDWTEIQIALLEKNRD